MTTATTPTSIYRSEMAELLFLLGEVASGVRIGVAWQIRAEQLRDSLIAGTPEEQRIRASELESAGVR
jgi:hypothetical protein